MTDMVDTDDMIEFFDDSGQKISVTRSEYRDKILPHNLKVYWDKPDALASHIMHAFEDGFDIELQAATEHLLKIDTMPERAICLYGGMLLQLEQYTEAESCFLEYLETHPKHPYVLTNLARAQDFLGKKEAALSTVEEALSLDPNQENALACWHALKQNTLVAEGVSPEDAALKILQQGNKQFGGWRSKFALGTYYLSKDDRETALRYYKVVLRGDWTPDALTYISGELAQYRLFEDMIGLIASHYDPRQHEPMTGFNLLQAYLQLEQVESGQLLLEKLDALHQPELQEQLAWYTAEFLQLIPDAVPEAVLPEAVLPEEDLSVAPLNIQFAFIDYPLWCYGWNIKHGFDARSAEKKIAFLQLACEQTEAWITLESVPKNKAARLTCAIPLFLVEDVYYGTGASASFVLPLNQDTGGGILYNQAMPKEEIIQLSGQGYDYAVTGMVLSNQLKLTVWDLSNHTEVSEDFSLNIDAPEQVISAVEAFLFQALDMTFDVHFKQAQRGFERVSIDAQRDYLMRLPEQLILYQIMKFPQLFEKIQDEAVILNKALQCALSTNNLQMQLNGISVIHICMLYHSEMIKTHQVAVFEWLDKLSNSKHVLQKIAQKTAAAFKKYCGTEQKAS
jgi:tetratricopeptide (TPR) repeat protein